MYSVKGTVQEIKESKTSKGTDMFRLTVNGTSYGFFAEKPHNVFNGSFVSFQAEDKGQYHNGQMPIDVSENQQNKLKPVSASEYKRPEVDRFCDLFTNVKNRLLTQELNRSGKESVADLSEAQWTEIGLDSRTVFISLREK